MFYLTYRIAYAYLFFDFSMLVAFFVYFSIIFYYLFLLFIFILFLFIYFYFLKLFFSYFVMSLCRLKQPSPPLRHFSNVNEI